MRTPDVSLREKLRAAYSEVAVDHVLNPRNNQALPNPDGFAEWRSDCGEIMKIWLKVRNSLVENAGFWTNGCAATIACGSMAVDLATGRSLKDALELTPRDISEALELPEGNYHCAEIPGNDFVSPENFKNAARG